LSTFTKYGYIQLSISEEASRFNITRTMF